MDINGNQPCFGELLKYLDKEMDKFNNDNISVNVICNIMLKYFSNIKIFNIMELCVKEINNSNIELNKNLAEILNYYILITYINKSHKGMTTSDLEEKLVDSWNKFLNLINL